MKYYHVNVKNCYSPFPSCSIFDTLENAIDRIVKVTQYLQKEKINAEIELYKHSEKGRKLMGAWTINVEK